MTWRWRLHRRTDLAMAITSAKCPGNGDYIGEPTWRWRLHTSANRPCDGDHQFGKHQGTSVVKDCIDKYHFVICIAGRPDFGTNIKNFAKNNVSQKKIKWV